MKVGQCSSCGEWGRVAPILRNRKYFFGDFYFLGSGNCPSCHSPKNPKNIRTQPATFEEAAALGIDLEKILTQ